MSTDEAPTPIWNRPEPGARSPRFSRQKIAAAALDVARRDGMQAVSMRRVATELGAGTMTLYHYVANKRELFDLVHDAMMGQLIVPEETLEQGWREALTAIAHSSLAAWRANRWQRDEIAQNTSLGPNGIRHFEQSLKAVSGTGLPADRRMEIISQVDEYVFGFAEGHPGDAGTFADWRAQMEGLSSYVELEMQRGDLPHLAELVGDEDFMTVAERMFFAASPEERFERGLARLLDGIEMEIERERA